MKANDLIKYFMIVEILFIVLVVMLKNVSEEFSILYSTGFWAWIFLPCMPFLAVLFGLEFSLGNKIVGISLLVIVALIFVFIFLFKTALKKQSKLLFFSLVCCWYLFSAFLLFVMAGVVASA